MPTFEMKYIKEMHPKEQQILEILAERQGFELSPRTQAVEIEKNEGNAKPLRIFTRAYNALVAATPVGTPSSEKPFEPSSKKGKRPPQGG